MDQRNVMTVTGRAVASSHAAQDVTTLHGHYSWRGLAVNSGRTDARTSGAGVGPSRIADRVIEEAPLDGLDSVQAGSGSRWGASGPASSFAPEAIRGGDGMSNTVLENEAAELAADLRDLDRTDLVVVGEYLARMVACRRGRVAFHALGEDVEHPNLGTAFPTSGGLEFRASLYHLWLEDGAAPARMTRAAEAFLGLR
jgi:hypothetical protein